MDNVLARKMWRTLEPYHGLVYFAPESTEAYEALGVTGRDGYFASRAASMGAVGPEVVIATFFNFNPELVRRAIPAAWASAPPGALVDARLHGIDRALRRTVGDLLDDDGVARAADLARVAVEACAPAGRPLFAGQAGLEWPAAPHLALWQGVSALREYRGDGHIACLVEAGLDGIDSLVLHAASGEVPRAVLQTSRGWSDASWDEAVRGLAERGLVDADGAFTPLGAELRAEIEARTDALAMAPWQALGQDGCDELRSLVRPLSRAVVDNGGLAALGGNRS